MANNFLLEPVSNANISLMSDLARRNQLRFDAILGAEIAGDYKPKPRVYLAAAEAFDLPPDECMMVSAALPGVARFALLVVSPYTAPDDQPVNFVLYLVQLVGFGWVLGGAGLDAGGEKCWRGMAGS